MSKSRSTISRRVNQLEENNWISRKPAGRTKIIQLTKQGYEIANLSDENTTPTVQEWDGDDSDRTAGDIRLHKVAVAFGIHDSPITDGWEKKIIESEDLRFRELEGDNSLIYTEDFTVRFTPKKAIFLVDNIVGEDGHELADHSINRAQSHRESIQDKLPFRLSTEPINMRVEVSEREFSIIKHPFAKAVIEDSPLKPSDIQFFEHDENHNLWIDNSNNEKELETGKGASFDEEDIQLLKKELEHKVKNPENTRRRRGLPNEVDDLENKLQEEGEKISDIEEATRVLLSRELRRSRERSKEKDNETIRPEKEEKDNPREGRRDSPSEESEGRDNSEREESPTDQIKSGFKQLISSFFSRWL